MKRISLIRVSIMALITAVCLAFAGCGEHAEPLDIDGPANWFAPAQTSK